MARTTVPARAGRSAVQSAPWTLVVPLFAALAVLVALPVGFVVLQAIFPAFNEGSLAHPMSAVGSTLGDHQTWSLLGNTLRFGITVAAVSLLLGVPLGTLRALYRVPLAGVWDLVFLVPFLIPPYLAAFGWRFLLQPHGYLEQLTGLSLGHLLFSFGGVAGVMALSVFPVVYFSVSRTLTAMGWRLVDVAHVFGAGPWRSFVRIAVPLALPAIAASALLTFTMAIEEFGIPAALGPQAGFSVLVASIESRFSDWPIDLSGAAVLSVLLAALALVAFVLQRALLAGRDFDSNKGKPAASVPHELGRWRWIVVGVFCVAACFSTIAPLFSIVASACIRTLSGGLSLTNLTLAHFEVLWTGGDGAQALGTSLALAGATAVLTGALGFLCSWCVVKSGLPGRSALDALSMMPHALPSIVVGVGLILAWNLPVWPITPYNTRGILLLSYSCLLLPYPIRYVSAALRQIGPSIEAAARVHGASAGRVVARIVMPLVAPSLISSMMIVFAIASRELVTSLLLAPSGVQTAATFAWQAFDQGSVGDGMAMGVLTLMISGTLLGLAARWLKRFDQPL
ncbi:binding-protein-dependent transport systems inner membrane component [Burkholderia sp. H160]|nr:binding-protein-dependent transport systems inner membrane component [Burkholderia sp. H160]